MFGFVVFEIIYFFHFSLSSLVINLWLIGVFAGVWRVFASQCVWGTRFVYVYFEGGRGKDWGECFVVVAVCL